MFLIISLLELKVMKADTGSADLEKPSLIYLDMRVYHLERLRNNVRLLRVPLLSSDGAQATLPQRGAVRRPEGEWPVWGRL